MFNNRRQGARLTGVLRCTTLCRQSLWPHRWHAATVPVTVILGVHYTLLSTTATTYQCHRSVNFHDLWIHWTSLDSDGFQWGSGNWKTFNESSKPFSKLFSNFIFRNGRMVDQVTWFKLKHASRFVLILAAAWVIVRISTGYYPSVYLALFL